MSFFSSHRRALLAVGLTVITLTAGSVSYASARSGANEGRATGDVTLSTGAARVDALAQSPVIEPEPQMEPSPVTAPANVSTPHRTPSPRPAFLVAMSKLNRLVLINGTSGNTTRVLADLPDTSECATGTGNVSLAPDRKTVYYVAAKLTSTELGPRCRAEIRRIPVIGGQSTLVTEGNLPHVSPDGSTLAFVRFLDSPDNQADLILRSLATGEERVLAAHIDCGCGGNEYDQMEIINVATGSRKALPTPSSIDVKRTWGSPSYLPGGNLFLLEQPDYDLEHGRPGGAPRMLVVDPSTSKVVRLITTGFEDRHYEGTDSDASGEHLMYLSNNNVMVSDHGKRPVQLASGVYSVDW